MPGQKSNSLQTSNEFSFDIRKAIELLSNSEGSVNDQDVLLLFQDNGISAKNAVEILLFLPIVFIRFLLPNFNWHDTYIERGSDGKQVEKSFKDTLSFQLILEKVTECFQRNPQSDTIIKIAGRSAEFHVINELLLKGEKLETLKLTKTVISR